MHFEYRQNFSKVVGEAFFKRIPIKKVCRENNIDLLGAKKMLSYFKNQIKRIKANNRKFLNKCKKIDETKLTLIKEFLNENTFKLFKLDNL